MYIMSKEIQEDFLEADDSIRGQNFACLSFISPENVLANKEIYKQQHFLRHLVKSNNINLSQEFINDLENKFKDFLYTNEVNLEKEFYKENDFRTTVRGVKVRGVYDTEKEARMKASQLQKKDKNFNVYVGQVGFWLPWDPSPNSEVNAEYFEPELNELVKKYKENQDNKETHFRENVDYVKEQAAKKVSDSKLDSKSDSSNVVSDDIKASLDSEDPWMAAQNRKVNNSENTKTL